MFTSEVLSMAATLGLMLILATYSWRNRSVPGALPFTAACLFTTLFFASSMMAFLVAGPAVKIFWLRFQAAWMPAAATAITCFVLEFTWPGRWLTRRNLALLSIIPVLSVLYFLGLAVAQAGEIGWISFDLANRAVVIYLLATTFANLTIFAWLFVNSPPYRWPVLIMACAGIYIAINIGRGAPPLGSPILNFFSITWPYMAYTVAMFGFRIFEPLSLARQMAIEQLHAGMIVLDPHERVISLNPSAERILGTTTGQARNCPAFDLLPGCSEDLLENPPGIDIECSLGSRSYTLSFSQLKDFRGLVAGYLLMLRDITEQKQAQARILEQQRTLAIKDERERTARDLHDSLGQVLSYASLQAQTAARLSRNGQGAAAEYQLDRLDSVVREAHADLREYILNLRSTASLQQPFFVAVKQYLDSFTANYDIQTLLIVSQDLNTAIFSPETQLQLFRILQEVLSNARKHGRAQRAQVSFSVENGNLRMIIEEDGCGFDPQEIARRGGDHYGLQFMQERAAQLDGSLQILSAPGSGTNVVLEIPLVIDMVSTNESGQTCEHDVSS